MRILISLLLSFFTFSCAIEKSENTPDKKRFVDPSKTENILLDKDVLQDSSFIIDKYPILGEIEVFDSQEKITTPRPKQLFSAASPNEIRLHKLGEIRWVYLGQEPSDAWPMTIGFLENNNDFLSNYSHMIALYRLGKYDLAEEKLSLIKNKYKEYPFFYELRGDIHFKEGNFNIAINEYEKAIQSLREVFPPSSDLIKFSLINY